MLRFLKDTISVGYWLFLKIFNKREGKEIVLLYHSIEKSLSHTRSSKLNLNPDDFEQEIKLLSRIFKNKITITFDDGFENFYYSGLPIILKYGLRCILFITVDFIDRKISSTDFMQDRVNPLNWEQVREAANAGIEIGSHTLTHRNLKGINEKDAYQEIGGSKKRIEDKIGEEVSCFAYPYGGKNSFNERTKTIVRNCGYKKAYTNIMGFNDLNTDSYELKRMRIYGDDSLPRFRLKIEGAYNWFDSYALKLWIPK